MITYTGPSATETRAHFSGGTGVSISSEGVVSVTQEIETTSNVTFNNITVSGQLNTDDITTATLTTSGNVVVSGNLTVNGTTTTINTTELNIGDNIFTLNSDLDSSTAPTQDLGIEIERGSASNVSLLWDEGNDRWTVGSSNFVASFL